MATIREKIYLRMKALNVKQVDLSEKVGIKTQNLSSYLRGNRTVPFEVLEKICMVLGLTLGDTDKVYETNKNQKECSEKKLEEK